jgi:hypothetical protein
MDDLVTRLDSDDPSVNSFGEIQDAGTRIDLLCAQIGVLRKMLREIERPDT